MKFGFNLLLWTPSLQENHFHLLSTLKSAGYDGVEIPLFGPDAAHCRKIGAALQAEGLKSTVVTVVPDEARSPISPDAGRRAAALDHLKQVVDSCEACGAEVMMGPFYQPLGVFSGTGPTTDELRWGADVHRELAIYAQTAGVKLSIESLNRFECYFLTTMAQAAAYAAMVGHPNFTTTFDTFHANIEERDPVAALREHYASTGHIHISENDRGTPGKGHAAIRETLQFLKEKRYDGWVTIEAFGRAMPEVAAATKIWRDVSRSEREVYEEGLAYIRQCLA